MNGTSTVTSRKALDVCKELVAVQREHNVDDLNSTDTLLLAILHEGPAPYSSFGRGAIGKLISLGYIVKVGKNVQLAKWEPSHE